MGSVSLAEEKETRALRATRKHSKKIFVICETRKSALAKTKLGDTPILDVELRGEVEGNS